MTMTATARAALWARAASLTAEATAERNLARALAPGTGARDDARRRSDVLTREARRLAREARGFAPASAAPLAVAA